MTAFAPNTNILMFDLTTKNISDLKIGNQLMSETSEPLIIKDIVEEENQMYDIIPIKGQKFTVSGDTVLTTRASNFEHISWDKTRKRYIIKWVENFRIKAKAYPISDYIKNKSSSKRAVPKNLKYIAYTAAKKYLRNVVPKLPGYTGYKSIVQIKVKDYIKLQKHVKPVYKLYAAAGLDFPTTNTSLDPYLLGYWLGDGTTGRVQITTAEPEIVDVFTKYANNNNLLVKKYGKYQYDLTTGKQNKGKNPLTNSLKQYDVWKDKHIPYDYMVNSRENRLKLLAGLVDSDGSNSHNSYQFVFKSEKLADDVILLAKTLGFRAFKMPRQYTCTNSSRGRVTGIYYWFIVNGEGIDEVPSILERKKTRARQTKKDAMVSGFNIVPAKRELSYKLIFEDFGEDDNKHLLLGDFTVVHY